MSSFKKITRHPKTGKWEQAWWLDDYFMPHVYGVKFADGKVYPTDLVENKDIHDFWANDVIAAFTEFLYGTDVVTQEASEDVIEFLNLVEKAYKARWKRDPLTGEGATNKSVVLRKN